MRPEQQLNLGHERRLLKILRIDVLPKIAALINFVMLTLKLRFEYSGVVAFFIMIDVGLLLELLALLNVMHV